MVLGMSNTISLIASPGRFEARATFDDRHVLKASGFRWCKDSKIWWTPDAMNVKRLEMNIGHSVPVHEGKPVDQEFDIPNSWEGHESCALDGPEDIPCPPGLAYLPYQRGGIAYARGKDGVLIADEMGLGKTIQAIGIMNDQPVKTALVICPASLKLNWAREIDKWLNYYLPVHVVEKVGHHFPSKIGVVIINYDIVAKMLDRLSKVGWDILICDEAHLLKNTEAKRTQAILGRAGMGGIKAGRRIFMTGTPVESRPSEIFTIANTLRPDVFPVWLDFAMRYCNAYMSPYGLQARGSSKTAELQAKLRQTMMIRRKKAEVLKDLPAKIRTIVEFSCPDLKIRKLVEEEMEAFEKERAVFDELVKNGASPDIVNAAKLEAQKRMHSIRRATTAAKMPQVLEFVENACENEKVVVFAKHHQVIDALEEKFRKKCVVITGKTPSFGKGCRQDLVDQFQTDPETTVFIGQVNAAGVGLTLTSASTVIFVEYDWRPGVLDQAEDRCHRIGQRDSVTCYYLVLEKSLDAVMLASINSKRSVINEAIDI